MNEKALENYSKLPENKCKNCSMETSGFFCPRCGQKHLSGRFTLKQSFIEIFDKIFNLNRGIFYTFLALLQKPGYAIQSYLDKATIRFMHPFRFIFILATISAILTILSGAFEVAELSFLGNGKKLSPEQIEKTEKILEFFKKYLTFFLLATIPLNALFTKIIYFRKKYNFAEHMILNSYAYGFTLIFSIPTYLLMLVPNGHIINGVLSFIIYYGGFSWIFSNFFKENFIVSFLKLMLLTILVIIIAIALVLLGIFIYVQFFKGESVNVKL